MKVFYTLVTTFVGVWFGINMAGIWHQPATGGQVYLALAATMAGIGWITEELREQRT